MRVSVHILSPTDARRDWFDACVASLAGQPVQVIHGEHIDGNLTAARLAVFERQDTEWVSWVDPDDCVAPDAYAAMLALADDGVGLVTGDELIIRPDGSACGRGYGFGKPITTRDIRRTPTAAHKGIVHRSAIPLAREIVGDDPFGIDWALMLAGTLVGEARKFAGVIYHWRCHPLQTHRHTKIDAKGITRRYDALRSRIACNA